MFSTSYCKDSSLDYTLFVDSFFCVFATWCGNGKALERLWKCSFYGKGRSARVTDALSRIRNPACPG